jgi:hypothetical protein
LAVTLTAKGAPNVLPLAALWVMPVVAVTATVSAVSPPEEVEDVELELLPPQPVDSASAKEMKIKMPA